MFCLFLILLSLLVIDEVCSKPRSPDNTLESASKVDHVIANEAHLQGIHISHVIHLASLISGPTWRSSLSNNWILELKEGLKREEELLKTKNLENNPEESIWWRPKKYKEFFLDLQNHTTKSSEQLVCVKCDGRKEGRLGNQLFKYAYARILTDHYKTSLSTFVEGDFPCLLDRLPILFYNSPPNLPYVGDQRCHTNSFRFISGHRYYVASFYASCRDKIKDELFAPSPFLKRYLPSPGPNDVVIHLRGGKGFCAKPEWIYKVMTFYYQTILEERKWDNVWLAAPPKEKLSPLSSFLIEKYNARWTPSDGPKSELEDLYFMMRANYLILDFGTFSFWGGFLSSAKEVHVPYCSVHHRMFVEPGADIPEEKDRWKVVVVFFFWNFFFGISLSFLVFLYFLNLFLSFFLLGLWVLLDKKSGSLC